MKNLIKIIIVVLTLCSCNAQQTYPLSTSTIWQYGNNNYIKDVDGVLIPFVGTWQWTQGNSSLTIKLVKVPRFKAPNDNYYKDQVLGGYKYIENGIIITDNLTFTTVWPDETNVAGFAKMLGSISYPKINELMLIFTDVIKNKSCMAELTMITNGGTPQLTWHLHDFQSYRNPNLGPKPLGFSIPTDIILTKIP